MNFLLIMRSVVLAPRQLLKITRCDRVGGADYLRRVSRFSASSGTCSCSLPGRSGSGFSSQSSSTSFVETCVRLGESGVARLRALASLLRCSCYLIAQHEEIAERNTQRSRASQQQFDTYVRSVAAERGPSDEIAKAKGYWTTARSPRLSSTASNRRRSPDIQTQVRRRTAPLAPRLR